MGCIRVKKLNDYLVDPIKAALQDEDPCINNIYTQNL
jgi:vesicle coat complex subunit